jgi:hypothetical protein
VVRKTVATRLNEAGLSARQSSTASATNRPSLTQDVYLGHGTASPKTAAVIRRALSRPAPSAPARGSLANFALPGTRRRQSLTAAGSHAVVREAD